MTVIARASPTSSAVQAMSWSRLVATSIVLYALYRLLHSASIYWNRSRSPLNKLLGPRTTNFLFGHARLLFGSERSSEMLQGWEAQYGHTFAVRGMLGNCQLVTTDARAIAHVLFASHVFVKPADHRRAMMDLFGEGVLTAEGEKHRDQRRIINPAFGFAQVRDMTEIFLEKAALLRDIWHRKCMETGGPARIDALHWMTKATLDIIGKAGFDYEFRALDENGAKSELAEAFQALFHKHSTPLEHAVALLYRQFPALRVFAPDAHARATDSSKRKMDEIGMRIVQEKKQAVLTEIGTGKIGTDTVGGRDLISLLLRANLADDLEPAQRLSDDEVVAQIPTFLAAGHETTSTSTAWAMYALASHLEAQAKLRAELQEIGTETPTLDMLNALPYLDHVVRETLRLYPVFSLITREASQDDAIPLGAPIRDANGELQNNIRIQKGDQVQIPVLLINKSTKIWGQDADEFRPERWENIPAEASSIPGIAPNLMTFFGGPRACVGHRFAVAEMKALLFHIVRGFEFRLAVEPSEVWSRTGVIKRVPQLRKDNSVQLPIYLTPVAQ